MQKIYASLFFLISGLLFWFLGPIFVKFFEQKLQKMNPKLVEKFPWYFTVIRTGFKILAVVSLFFAIFVLFKIK